MKVANLVHHRYYIEPASRNQDTFHLNPASRQRLNWSSGGCCSSLGPNPGYVISAAATSQESINRRASILPSPARHHAQRPSQHSSSGGLLASSEESSSSRKPPSYRSRGRHGVCKASESLRRGTTVRTRESSPQDDASMEGTTSRTPTSLDLASQI